MKRRKLSRCLALRHVGRSQHGRSTRANCRPSGCLSRARLCLTANGSPHWFSDCANSVGSRIAPSRSSNRWAEGRGERYAEIAAEYVRLKVDVIVTTGLQPPKQKRRHRPSRLFSRCQGTRSALAWLRV
jgi:hypothetical protein